MKISDMLFANAMMGEGGGGGGGGGGGSSDFTTCTVTMVNESGSYYSLTSAFKYENGELGEGSPACMFPQLSSSPHTTAEGTLVLYKGEAYGIFLGGTPVYTLSGDIAMINPEYPENLHITGNGTITISA